MEALRCSTKRFTLTRTAMLLIYRRVTFFIRDTTNVRLTFEFETLLLFSYNCLSKVLAYLCSLTLTSFISVCTAVNLFVVPLSDFLIARHCVFHDVVDWLFIVFRRGSKGRLHVESLAHDVILSYVLF